MNGLAETVASVHLYAIKSCQETTVEGNRPRQLEVGPTGFVADDVRDREFVLAEAEPMADGRLLFLSQRGWGESGRLDRDKKDDSRLATVETNIDEHELLVTSAIGDLTLRTQYRAAGEAFDVKIHGSTLPVAFDQGPKAARYFSELLGRPIRLLRANRSQPRWQPEQYQRSGAANQVAAADGQPFLLTSQASLDEAHFQADLEKGTVPMECYRPNIVIAGKVWGAYQEDYLGSLVMDQLQADVVKACKRCPIPNVDQSTGERTAGGLKLIGKNRLGFTTDAPDDVKPVFGQNLNHYYDPYRKLTVYVGAGIQASRWSRTRNFTLLSEAA